MTQINLKWFIFYFLYLCVFLHDQPIHEDSIQLEFLKYFNMQKTENPEVVLEKQVNLLL